MLKKVKAVSPVLFFILAFSACKKEDSSIGLDVQPEGDLLSATYCDTLTVESYILRDDSMRTDENSLTINYAMLGSLSDPAFGRTDASIYTNFVMPNNVIGSGFGSLPKLDSVVLSLTYHGSYYGDKTDALKLNVYKLADSLAYSNSYYSHQDKLTDPSDYTYSGSGTTITPAPTTSVTVGDAVLKPHMRIRLKNELGQYFMDDTTRIGSTAALQSAFRGLLITARNTAASTNYGSIVYITMTDAQTKLTVYYHNGNDPTVKALDLGIGTSAARYNRYEHDYTNAEDSLNLQLPPVSNLTVGNQLLFLQGLAGLKANISFPYLKSLSDSGEITINKAELILKANGRPDFYDPVTFPTPTKLTLEGLNSFGNLEPLPESADAFAYGGTFNSTTGEYIFNIPYTAQRIVSGKVSNYKFQLSVFQRQLYPSPALIMNPGRVVLCGADHPLFPIKLKVWYTRVR